ncbi:hypothetical protein VNO78_06936 [Psophocarpus tetragonolobus]|uniref:Uncharacterized protein n=1 Tax=Psophocarpus tetragonolobus TaxID=3891 RepID=A0AAN9STQ8_PSOTE
MTRPSNDDSGPSFQYKTHKQIECATELEGEGLGRQRAGERVTHGMLALIASQNRGKVDGMSNGNLLHEEHVSNKDLNGNMLINGMPQHMDNNYSASGLSNAIAQLGNSLHEEHVNSNALANELLYVSQFCC